MAAASNHFKLGLFALGAIIGIFAVAFTLGVRTSRSVTIVYHTYFDESVQGLELGAPVKYRGVKIGKIAAIDVAPDRRHVDVSSSLVQRDVERLGLATPNPNLRAYLSTQGITGLKFIDFDFADSAPPPAPLAFAPAAHWVPVETSLLKRLEDRSDQLGIDAVAVLTDATATLHRLDDVLDDIHAQRLPARVAGVLDRTGESLADVRRLVRSFDHAQMPTKAAAALDSVNAATTDLRSLIDAVSAPDGLVAATRRSVDAFGNLGRSLHGSASDLERTIRDFGDAARGVRDFFDELERDPDMLVKGRAKANGP